MPSGEKVLFSYSCGDGFAKAGIAGELGGFIGCLPGEVGIVAAEVSVSGGFAIDRTAQLQGIDDALGRELEMRADEVGNNLGINFVGAEGLNRTLTGSATPMAYAS